MMVLPYPPSVNRYWRSFRGRMVRSAAAVEYKEVVRKIARLSGGRVLDGSVAVAAMLHPVLPKDWARREKKRPGEWQLDVRRTDLDNAMKVALDALQGICYEDDRQIVEIVLRLGRPITGGGLTVAVRQAEWGLA